MDIPVAHLFDVVITPWKLIGYLGVLLFAGRWVVQLVATRRQGEPTFPALFWTMSVMGSSLLLAYFVWGKNDSVGVFSNLFPMAVALYNLTMHRAAARRAHAPESARCEHHGFLHSVRRWLVAVRDRRLRRFSTS